MMQSTMECKFRRRKRKAAPTTSLALWLLLLMILLTIKAAASDTATLTTVIFLTTAPSSSSSSTVQSSGNSSVTPIPHCDLHLVSSVHMPPASVHAPNLSTSALLYSPEFPDDELDNDDQRQIEPVPLDVQMNCSKGLTNFTQDIVVAFFNNNTFLFEGTLLQLQDHLRKQLEAELGQFELLPYSEQQDRLYPYSNYQFPYASIDDPRQASLDPLNENGLTLLWNCLLLLGYGLILLVSLPGNLLVIRIIVSTPKLRTTTNILILSLTVSDIATTIFNIPFMCARTMLRNWPLPDFFCLLMPTVQVCSVYVSTLTMAAIGIHRFRAVRVGPLMATTSSHNHNHNRNLNNQQHQSKPYSPYVMTKAKIAVWIGAIWAVSILLALPHSLFNQVVTHSPSPYLDPNGQSRPARRCRAIYPAEYENTVPLILSLETSLTQYLLPLTVTAVLYTKIALIIQRQGQLARHFCDESNRRAVEAKRKRISMLIIVVAAFALSWAPLNCYHLLIDLHQISFDYSVFMVLHQLAVLSVCYNPFIYCWMNEAFRVRAKKYLRLVGKLCPCLRWLCWWARNDRRGSRKRTTISSSQRRTLRCRLLCISGNGSGSEGAGGRCSSTGTSTVAEEAYSLSGVTNGGLTVNNNTRGSFTRNGNSSNSLQLHKSASAATIADTLATLVVQ